MPNRKGNIDIVRDNSPLAQTSLTQQDYLTLNEEASKSYEQSGDDDESIMLVVDGKEEELNPSDTLTLVCLSEGESENENQMPSLKDVETSPTNWRIQVVTSPLKRSLPLSPTLQDNVHVQLLQVHQRIPFVEDVSTPSTSDKNDNGILSPVGRNKRRRLCTADSLSTKDLTQSLRTPTPTLPQNQKAASQQETPVVDTCDKISLPEAKVRILDDYYLSDAPPVDDTYLQTTKLSESQLWKNVQYELDEVDTAWLDLVNESRSDHEFKLCAVTPEEMELLMDRFEKENYFEMRSSGKINEPGECDEDAVCCICLDGESDNSNLIIFCDMCNIPVHQDCFGVPFIPEGSWLCRRCTITPNGDVDCIFCPNKDGAFKQTADGRWAHVLCALWIPEVRFSNPSLVEPVDDIDDIPPGRWKLVCFLCKKKGVGACIQCHLRTCVTAFHATCAQAAGLSLKLVTKGLDSNTTVRMTPSCDKHTTDADKEMLTQKIETVNKLFNEKRSIPAEMSCPTFSSERINEILELVSFPGKRLFVRKLYSYWRLKRKSRGGAPLLRSLDLICTKLKSNPPIPDPLVVPRPPFPPDLRMHCFEKMTSFKKDLETVKNVVGLLKDQGVAQKEHRELSYRISLMRMQHLDPLFISILEEVSLKDTKQMFAEPVTEEDAPDYFTTVTNPMDLSTIREKIYALQYTGLDDLESDFKLMLDNCTTYNESSTIYYKTAMKMKDTVANIFQAARLKITERAEAEKEAITANIPRERLESMYLKIVNRIDKKDNRGIFTDPVDEEDAPGYFEIISKPMDLSTMRKKVIEHEYRSIDALEADVHLMLDNCMRYNDDDTIFYKIAVKLKEFGDGIIQATRQKIKGMLSKSEESDGTNISFINDVSESME